MATVTNSFEGGTNGTAITTANSGGASGNAFDNTFLGTGATITYDNTHIAHGNLAFAAAAGATQAQAIVEWNTSLGSGLAQVWFRIYIYLTANPSAAFGPVVIKTGHGGTQCSRVAISTAGVITFNDAANTAQLTFTNNVPLNQWFRLEGFTVASATVGQLEAKLFSSMDSTSPTETQTSAANLNTGASIGEIQLGGGGAGLKSLTVWFDDIGATDSGYLGPAVSAGPAVNQYPITPGETWTRNFLHPQKPTPPSDVLFAIPTATVSVSAQADNGLILSPSPNNADVAVNTTFADSNVTFFAPRTFQAFPGDTWIQHFRKPQILQPQPTVVVAGTLATVSVATPAGSLSTAFSVANADISVNGLPGIASAILPPTNFVTRSQAGETWLQQFHNKQARQEHSIVPMNLQNIFEGGTNGQTLTQGISGNTGGLSGDYLDEIHLGTSGSAIFDNTQFAHGSQSVKLSTGAASSPASLWWDNSGQAGAQGRVWFRLYLFFTANPASTIRIWNATQDGGIGSCSSVSINSSGKLVLTSSNAGTVRYTFSTVIPLNQWFRVEGTVSFDNTKGSMEVRLFKTNSDGDINSYDETSGNITSINTTGIPVSYRFGVSAGVSNVAAFWMDEIALSNVTWVGPFVGNTAIAGTDADIPVVTTFGDQLVTVASSNNNSDVTVTAIPGSLFRTQYTSQVFPGRTWVKNFLHPQVMISVPPISIGGSTATVTVTAIAGGVGSPGVSANFPAIVTVNAPVVNVAVTQYPAFPGDTWIKKFQHPQQITPPAAPFTLFNNFEGGVNGTNLTAGSTGNTGGISGDFFDDISRGAGATLAFDNSIAAHGIYSTKIATGSTTAVSTFKWIRAIQIPSLWFRAYLYFTAFPANNHRIFLSAIGAGGSNITSIMAIDSTGHLYATAGTSATRVFTFTNTVPLNQWFRVEGNVIGDPVNGYIEIRMFSTTPDGNINSYDEVNSASGINTNSGLQNQVDWGPSNTVANIGPFWLDEVSISNVTWIGPVAVNQSFGATTDIPVGATFADQTTVVSPSALANITVAANAGTIISNPPPVFYPIQPGRTWTKAFIHPQKQVPPSPTFVPGFPAAIVVDGSGAGVSISSFNSGVNADIQVVAQAGTLSGSFPSNVGSVIVTAQTGMVQVNNQITPAIPGKTWIRNFRHPQISQVTFQMFGANFAPIIVSATSAGVGVSSITANNADIAVSGQNDNHVAILLPPKVLRSQPGATWLKRFKHPQTRTPPSPVLIFGVTASVTVATSGSVVVNQVIATENIAVATSASEVVSVPQPVLGPLTVVQSIGPVQVQNLTGPLTATFGSATASGNTLVACITTNATTSNPVVSSITTGATSVDNWRRAFRNSNSVDFGAELWYDPGCLGGQTQVIVNCGGGSGGSADIYLTVYEVQGVLIFDKGSFNDSPQATPVTTFSSGATATTLKPNEIFFGVVTANNQVPVVTGVGTWTTLSTGLGQFDQVAGFQIVSSTGTATFSGTLSGGSGSGYSALVGTFYRDIFNDVITTALPGSLPINIAGSTATVAVATSGTVSDKLTGVTSTVTIVAPAGIVTEQMYVPQINVQVYVAERHSLIIAGSDIDDESGLSILDESGVEILDELSATLRPNITVAAPTGTLPRSILGQTSNIIVNAPTGPVGNITIFGSIDTRNWAGTTAPVTSGAIDPDDTWQGTPTGVDDE